MNIRVLNGNSWHFATLVEGNEKTKTCVVKWASTMNSNVVATSAIDFTELKREQRNRKPPTAFNPSLSKNKKVKKKSKKENLTYNHPDDLKGKRVAKHFYQRFFSVLFRDVRKMKVLLVGRFHTTMAAQKNSSSKKWKRVCFCTIAKSIWM